jgi:hypothetical protein
MSVTKLDPTKPSIVELQNLIDNPPNTSRIIDFTPALAQYILDNLNTVNRPRKAAKIRLYADDMANKKWGLTGDTLKFGKDGLLKDGQNRLAACVRANVTFRSHAVFGIDAALFARMDIGKPRNGADVLGYKGVDYAGHTSAMVRWHIILNSEDPANRGPSFTNEQIVAAYDALDPDRVLESVKAASAVNKTTHHPVGPLAALHMMFSEISSSKADAFYREWGTGVTKKGRSPTRYLQERLIELSTLQHGRIHETVRNALIIKAWNAYVSGRAMTKREMNFNIGDTFPDIKGK